MILEKEYPGSNTSITEHRGKSTGHKSAQAQFEHFGSLIILVSL